MSTRGEESVEGRDYLTRLAGLAAGTRFDGLPAATVAAARAVTLDTLGAMLAGSRLAENARLADLAVERPGSRAATIVGHGRKAEPMLAALVNGTAGVSLEMDEGNRRGIRQFMCCPRPCPLTRDVGYGRRGPDEPVPPTEPRTAD